MGVTPWAGEQDAAGDEEEGGRHEEEDKEQPLGLVHVETEHNKLLEMDKNMKRIHSS